MCHREFHIPGLKIEEVKYKVTDMKVIWNLTTQTEISIHVDFLNYNFFFISIQGLFYLFFYVDIGFFFHLFLLVGG